MLKLSKFQFSRAIEDSEGTTGKKPPRYAQNASKRTSKFLITALVVALGIGAGWIGGKVLNGRMSQSTAAATPGDVSAVDNPAPSSQPQPESRPGKRAETAEKPATPSQPASEAQQPVVTTETPPVTKEPAPKGAASGEVPPGVPRVDKEEGADKPAAEDPSKEIGREALKKINKEIANMNGNSPGTKKEKTGNKNEN